MKAEIISTGREIVTGSVIDSNSAYISEKLEEIGVDVVRHTAVGDEMNALVSVFREVGERSDLAIVTGGLGPTSDDLTAEAAARAAGVSLCLDESANDSVNGYFREKNIPVSDSNKKQALLPSGSSCMKNPIGTAPGFALTIGGCRFFFMPGVPHEMRHMLSNGVIPEIEALQGGKGKVNLVRTMSVFGLPESVVGDRLEGIEDEFEHVRLGLRAVFPVIQVKLYASGAERAIVERELDGALCRVKERIGKYVFSDNGETMEAETGRLLREKFKTLALAESCTGGLIGHLITSVAGSSDYFLFSGVTYSNQAKIDVLGVLPETLEQHGAVSEETVTEMARGARKIAGADYAIATSGIAGPGGGTPDKPVGTVCLGVASENGVKSFTFRFPFGERDRNKELFAIKALDLLRRELLAS